MEREMTQIEKDLSDYLVVAIQILNKEQGTWMYYTSTGVEIRKLNHTLKHLYSNLITDTEVYHPYSVFQSMKSIDPSRVAGLVRYTDKQSRSKDDTRRQKIFFKNVILEVLRLYDESLKEFNTKVDLEPL